MTSAKSGCLTEIMCVDGSKVNRDNFKQHRLTQRKLDALQTRAVLPDLYSSVRAFPFFFAFRARRFTSASLNIVPLHFVAPQ